MGIYRYLLLALVLGLLLHAQAMAKPFHDQPPMANAEVERFVKDFPAFKQWMYDSKLNSSSARPVVDKEGNPSFVWNENVVGWFEGKEWTPERFFYVMTHCSAGISLILHEDEFKGANRPPDMPLISDYELNLVRQYQKPLMDSLSTKIRKKQ